jgi:hypothetical protein
MGWPRPFLRRRSVGYWNDLGNIKIELDEFAEDQAIPAGVVPSKQVLQKLGRYDLAKGIEKAGGFRKARAALTMSLEQ